MAWCCRSYCCCHDDARRANNGNTTHDRRLITATLLIASVALACTGMTFDLYAIALGIAATGFLLASSSCQNTTASGYVSACTFAFAAAVICAMNIVSIALTDVCEDDIDTTKSSNSTSPPDGTNQTDVADMEDADDNDDDEYTFFCKYQQVLLAMSIVATILWIVTGKLTMDISKLPTVQVRSGAAANRHRGHSNANRNAFHNDQDGDTVASDESFEQQLRHDQEQQRQQTTMENAEHTVEVEESAIINNEERRFSSAAGSSRQTN